jgi:hypothetical protein
MAFAHPAAILAKIAFHVHRDRKARAGALEKEPLMYFSGPNSQFKNFRDKMPALGKSKPIAIHRFVESVQTRYSHRSSADARKRVGAHSGLRLTEPLHREFVVVAL